MIDVALDHLRVLELIGSGASGDLGGGFDPRSLEAGIHLSALALHMYVRGEGSSCDPVAYWQLEEDPTDEDEPTHTDGLEQD